MEHVSPVQMLTDLELAEAIVETTAILTMYDTFEVHDPKRLHDLRALRSAAWELRQRLRRRAVREGSIDSRRSLRRSR
jgi:hypothetical protein